MKKYILALITAALVFPGCDIQKMEDTGSAYIAFASTEAPGANTRAMAPGTLGKTRRAIMGFIDDDAFYNFNDMKDIKDFTGEGILFTGLPVGRYTFVTSLMGEQDRVLAMGIEGVEIKAGMNQMSVDMGPGFKMEVSIPTSFTDLAPYNTGEKIDLSLSNLTKDAGLSYRGRTMNIKLPSRFSKAEKIAMSKNNINGAPAFQIRVQTLDTVTVEVVPPPGITGIVILAPGGGLPPTGTPATGNNVKDAILEFRSVSGKKVPRDFVLVLKQYAPGTTATITPAGAPVAPESVGAYPVHLEF